MFISQSAFRRVFDVENKKTTQRSFRRVPNVEGQKSTQRSFRRLHLWKPMKIKIFECTQREYIFDVDNLKTTQRTFLSTQAAILKIVENFMYIDVGNTNTCVEVIFLTQRKISVLSQKIELISKKLTQSTILLTQRTYLTKRRQFLQNYVENYFFDVDNRYKKLKI